MNRERNARCQVCGRVGRRKAMVPIVAVREQMLAPLRASRPGWDEQGFICTEDLDAARVKYVEQLIAAEQGELGQLEQEVVQSFSTGDLIAEDTNARFARQLGLGDRVADQIAAFGGSWRFILLSAATIAGWIALNSYLLARPFDPYPFILLNLALSCVAAFQAPVIMMSQNRQAAKDRLQADHDYQVNLKAELEVRQLQEKLDHLVGRQWERLAEIQRVQVELLNDIVVAGARRAEGAAGRGAARRAVRLAPGRRRAGRRIQAG